MYCPNCGRQISEGSHFCPYCGADVEGTPLPSEEREADASRASIPPKDLDQLLGETFGIYRRYPGQFLFLGFLPQIPSLLSIAAPGWLSVLLTIIGVAAYILVGGAAAYAVAQQSLGREIDVGYCLSKAWSRAFTLIGASVLLLLALAGSAVLMVIIVGIPLFFFLLVSWFFVEQAIMIEGQGSIEAFGRSRNLVRGTWWRVFGIGVVFGVILIVLGVIEGFVSSGVGLASPTAGAIIGAIISMFIFPIAAIGATLVYFDLRARKEGYDLQEMASEVAPTWNR